MKALLLFCLLACGLQAAGQTLPMSADSLLPIDRKYGFMGASFGSNQRPTAITIECGAPKSGRTNCRPTGLQAVAGEPVQDLLWSYFNGELESAMFVTTPQTDFKKLLETLVAAYGPARYIGNDLVWMGKKATATFSKNGNEWTFYISSILIKQKQKLAEAEAAKKQAEKL